MVSLCPISVTADCVMVLKSRIARPGEYAIKHGGADKAAQIKSVVASYKL